MNLLRRNSWGGLLVVIFALAFAGCEGNDGAPGPAGADGQDGADGADGQDGADAVARELPTLQGVGRKKCIGVAKQPIGIHDASRPGLVYR